MTKNLLSNSKEKAYNVLAWLACAAINRICSYRPPIRLSACDWRDGGVTFSQFGEDVVLSQLFSRKAGGFYVDVGAYHPIRCSNTALLHKLGWSGINIDASEQSIALFNQLRPMDRNILCPVSNEEKEVFFPIKANLKNQISTENIHGTMRGMKTRRLQDILEMEKIRSIDLLTIDCEGEDEKIIRSFDFEKFSIQVLVIEVFEKNDLTMLADFLDGKGFELYSSHVFSHIFRKKQSVNFSIFISN